MLIAGLLSPQGVPARILASAEEARFDLIVSDALLAGTLEALSYPRVRAWITASDSAAFERFLLTVGERVAQPENPLPFGCRDPDDEYLLALARAASAILVSGDRDLLSLRGLPVESPRAFFDRLDALRR